MAAEPRRSSGSDAQVRPDVASKSAPAAAPWHPPGAPEAAPARANPGPGRVAPARAAVSPAAAPVTTGSPAAPVPPITQATERPPLPPQAVVDPVVEDRIGVPAGNTASGKTVPGVTVGWSDLHAAVEAGWLKPEAAHAIWARWLARKPISRIEDDGTPMPPAPTIFEGLPPVQTPLSLDPAILPAQDSIAAGPAPEAGAIPPSGLAPTAEQAPLAPSSPSLADAPDPHPPPRVVPETASGSSHAPAPEPPEEALDTSAGPPSRQEAVGPGEAEAPPADRLGDAAKDPAVGAAADPTLEPDDAPGTRAPAPQEPPPEAPSTGPAPRASRFVEAEVLEPLDEANARRAAERAAQARPTIEVVDVIEVRSVDPPAPQARDGAAGRAGSVGRFALALMAAVGAAMSVGLGSTLFGPWGGVAAGMGWTFAAWRLSSRWHRQGQSSKALLGAHLVLILTAMTVWQLQVASGLWPPVQPLDLFADAPLPRAAPGVDGLQLDGRWLTLAGVPLVAALIWLVRLRHPLLLGSVTVLLWIVAFHAVAGVLQAMGLAFHGMSTFMVLLGTMTLGAALYIDVKARAARLVDHARWVYVAGMLLLGAGWLSLAPLPMPMPVLRYPGWALVLMMTLAVGRPALVALALGFLGFDLAWLVRAAWASEPLAVAAWVLGLFATAALTMWVRPRIERLARPLRFWMPSTWRQTLNGTRRGQG